MLSIFGWLSWVFQLLFWRTPELEQEIVRLPQPRARRRPRRHVRACKRQSGRLKPRVW